MPRERHDDQDRSYDCRWPAQFETEAACIREAIGSVISRIAHVGSTAVPGLAAKPVIDIQISVVTLERLDRYAEPLAQIGYRHIPIGHVDLVYPPLNRGSAIRSQKRRSSAPCWSKHWRRGILACRGHDAFRNSQVNVIDNLEIIEGIGRFRPRGETSLIEAVESITHAIAYCRQRSVNKLLVNATGLVGLPIPSLVDRFLMVEMWAQAAKGMVAVVMVVPAEYIHPEKFGVKVAADFGLVAGVHTSETDAFNWLAGRTDLV